MTHILTGIIVVLLAIGVIAALFVFLLLVDYFAEVTGEEVYGFIIALLIGLFIIGVVGSAWR